jgi:hypothetical protein
MVYSTRKPKCCLVLGGGVFLASRLGAALLPALAVEELAVRALLPRERLVANLVVRKIITLVVVVVRNDVVHGHEAGESHHA